MESVLLDILDMLRKLPASDDARRGDKLLQAAMRKHDQGLTDNSQHCSKRKLLSLYLDVRDGDRARWLSWNVDPELEERLLRLLRMKPGRTAGGVATISVLTKPWPCSGECLYCPNDLRMPKSYLSSEPACQRAERNYFDPYLQVSARLKVLQRMGHPTGQVELMVLGGTWDDYPAPYRQWFVSELYRALNNGVDDDECQKRRAVYESRGLVCLPEECERFVEPQQAKVNSGETSYNRAWGSLYGPDTMWGSLASWQEATMEQARAQLSANATAAHHVAGLSLETRPDAVTDLSLDAMEQLGCTRVQVGLQSLDEDVLRLNGRHREALRARKALELIRLHGFKLHAHLMVNLPGSTMERDREEYHRLVHDPAYIPDEVKLYPCVLVEGTGLGALYDSGAWQPYPEDQLVKLLADDLLDTPPYVRVSRMIRDISSNEILAGSKRVNLRQYVEEEAERSGRPLVEMRSREVGANATNLGPLHTEKLEYDTTVTHEVFYQLVTESGGLVAYARISYPSGGGDPILRELKMSQMIASFDSFLHIDSANQVSQLIASFDSSLKSRGDS